jgi:hypothetical protein
MIVRLREPASSSPDGDKRCRVADVGERRRGGWVRQIDDQGKPKTADRERRLSPGEALWVG